MSLTTIGNLFRKHKKRFDVSGKDCSHRDTEATSVTRGSEETVERIEQFRSLNIQEEEPGQELDQEPDRETLGTKSSFEEVATTPTLCQVEVETSSRNQSMSDQDKLIGDEELMDTREGACFFISFLGDNSFLLQTRSGWTKQP